MSARANLTSWNKTQWIRARFEILTAVKISVCCIGMLTYCANLLLKWVCQDTNNDSDGEWGIKDVFCYAY